jgi:hypothetical protein
MRDFRVATFNRNHFPPVSVGKPACVQPFQPPSSAATFV